MMASVIKYSIIALMRSNMLPVDDENVVEDIRRSFERHAENQRTAGIGRIPVENIDA